MTKTTVKLNRKRNRKAAGEFKLSAEMVPSFDNGKPTAEFIQAYKAKALQAFETIEFPKRTDESWRRTDISKLSTSSFELNKAENKLSGIPEEILEPLVGENYAGQVLLSGTASSASLQEELKTKGVIFTDLKTAFQQAPEKVEKILGQVVSPDEGKFAAAAGAFSANGVFLYVPKNTIIDEPLHSVLWADEDLKIETSHILVYIEEGASLTYVHESASKSNGDQTMHTGLVEIYVGPNANLNFVEMQSWDRNMWHFTHERARIDRDAKMDWIFGGLGSNLTKSFISIDLIGKGAEGRMSGFVFTDEDQHLDLDTKQTHRKENTHSDMLFKAALEDTSRSVWRGMIEVEKGAQRTDGYQSNQNLVLSEKARVDSIPGLEILADDVRCTHGSTVSDLDQEEIFYLLTRGIPRITAERLMIEGFFDPIMQRIPFEGVRSRFQQAIKDKLKVKYT